MYAAGALRIDHILGLTRQFWIPDGAPPAEGTYIQFPIDDLLAILAIESHQHHCLVIGEDLGTVPDGLRPLLEKRGVLRTQVLYFERQEDGGFQPPEGLARNALLTANTHDVPTLKGFVAARDVDRRLQLGLVDNAVADRMLADRAQDRRHLENWLQRPGESASTRHDKDQAMVLQIYEKLAQSPAQLLAVSLDDLLGEMDAINVPGQGPKPGLAGADGHAWTYQTTSTRLPKRSKPSSRRSTKRGFECGISSSVLVDRINKKERSLGNALFLFSCVFVG